MISALPPQLEATQRPPRLLVVDDQPINVQALYEVFSLDHQVLMATSGAQALRLAAARQPDLVLLDVEMPGMDGMTVCRRMKEDELTRDIPVVFVTARNDEASEVQCLQAGAVDFISKPINPTIVRARVRTHLTLKAQSDLLRQWAYIDGLTGVLNRRCWEERLLEEWQRSNRNGSDLSMLLIDVDHFKRYNDHYGHQAGDDCLRQVAHCLRQALRRPGDLLVRYGGEEFACLLPETSLPGALQVAEHLGAAVSKAAMPHACSDVAPHVTVSLGVSSKLPGVRDDAATLVQVADEQLYRAKQQGRDRTLGSWLTAAEPPSGRPEPDPRPQR